MIEFEYKGKKYYIDYDKYKKEQLFLDYKAMLLDLVGFTPRKLSVDKAHKFMYDRYPEYREIIDLTTTNK